jgi:excisionase family DNA binding protein
LNETTHLAEDHARSILLKPEEMAARLNHARSTLLRPEEVAARLGLSRARVYELMGTGAIPSVAIGRSRRVRLTDLIDYVEALSS